MQRKQIIDTVMARQPKETQALIVLWEKLAAEIISLMGDAGFDSLYGRSVYLTHASFPWLTDNALPAEHAPRFSALKNACKRQTPANIGRANALLLLNFTDILASLIGEALTISILRSAWGQDASDQAGKEQSQ